MTLSLWVKSGVFPREIALYRRLIQRGVGVSFVTYGSKKDLAYRDQLSGINLICNRWRLPNSLYIRLLYNFLPMSLSKTAVVKSNQVLGADVAMRAARRFGRPFIARCGYLQSEIVELDYGKDSLQSHEAQDLERIVFNGADRVVITTDRIQQKIISNYQVPRDRVRVIPNYVDTDLFCPNLQITRIPNRVCFIGRLVPVKNLMALLDGCAGLDIELVIVGGGSQEKMLKDRAAQIGLSAHFLGNLSNELLPDILNSATAFILPSLTEGHPKSLMEAMSCGLPVIGTDVPGILDVLKHRETGFLCGTNSGDIRAALQEVLGDPSLRQRLGVNARQEVLDKYSLDRVVELEINLLQEFHI
ncbi:MAG: glycosyltransferase family 1 protein [Saprospiraceae bacterium]|nr:MAG: glycosyltransferase family 1 protein [Saprospiraceae bacterium]